MMGVSQRAGVRLAAEEASVDDAIADEVEASSFATEPVEAASRDWQSVWAKIATAALATGWIATFVLAHADAFDGSAGLGQIATLIAQASAPLALLALVYLIVVRASRSEASRLGKVSAELRAEHARLEAVMASVASRLTHEHLELTAHTDRLMRAGEDAGWRLNEISERLRTDLDGVVRDAEALRNASQTARNDITTLISDLPRAQAQATAMSDTLTAAGLSAHEQAGALDAQIVALVARGREADEVAGGAAQKLAAHLARVEGVSETAGARLVAAAETMTGAIDAALERAAEAGDAARQGMEAQAAAMRALVEQSEAALARTGTEASEAIAQRVDAVTERLEALGALLSAHETQSNKLLYGINAGIDRIDERFVAIDAGSEERQSRLSSALAALASHAESLAAALDRGGASADSMIGKTETLMTALDATAREIEDTLPAAFARIDAGAETSRAKIATLAPEVARIEREASAALDRLLEAEKLLAEQKSALDSLGGALDAQLAAARTSANDLVSAVEGADARARAIAEGAGTTLVEAMVRVRETAQTAADRAREALANVVPESADRLANAVREALTESVTGEVEAQIGKLAANAEAAVGAANSASDRLMRQMLTIAETSAQVEARIAEAHGEIDAADSDNFSRRVALLIESLNSTAIDVTKILSNEVTDTAWNAYLKGDRGVFTRRAVRLLDAGEVREINRHYADDPEFRDQVNRYVHDFEAMLRNVLATRSGSPLSVTLLSSDMGKLYVALAQAIERLRT